MNVNTLIVAGTGIKFLSHLTIETKACIEKSDCVLYLLNNPAIRNWIKKNNNNSKSLEFLYNTSRTRNENYLSIARYVNDVLDKTTITCLIMYGHPVYLADPSMYTINIAKKNGHEVYVLPGISSIDCLFADLVIDPSTFGYQVYEATDFLIHQRKFDTSSHLIILQATMIGIKTNFQSHSQELGLEMLTKYLLKKYSEKHKIILYEAAQYPMMKPKLHEINLIDLPNHRLPLLTTLYIPPERLKKKNQLLVKILKEINI